MCGQALCPRFQSDSNVKYRMFSIQVDHRSRALFPPPPPPLSRLAAGIWRGIEGNEQRLTSPVVSDCKAAISPQRRRHALAEIQMVEIHFPLPTRPSKHAWHCYLDEAPKHSLVRVRIRGHLVQLQLNGTCLLIQS